MQVITPAMATRVVIAIAVGGAISHVMLKDVSKYNLSPGAKNALNATTILAALVFLLNLLPYNLHCTQSASLISATFELKAHPEEEEFQYPIYNSPYSIPIRFMLLVILLLHLFTPIWVVVKTLKSKINLLAASTFLTIAYVCIIGMNTFVYRIAGERFESIYERSTYTSWSIYVFTIITIILYRNNKLHQN